MEGPDDRPLLVLGREGEGRVALLASDHAWLWSRGYEGGGPQLELLRRLAHWLMQEPELEEEVLRGTGEDGGVSISRRTLGDSVPPVIATSPSGAMSEVVLTEVAPGRWEGRIDDAENGVWRLENGDQQAVAVVGPSSPKEFENPVSTGDVLAPLAEATRGGGAAPRGRPARPAAGARGPGRGRARLDRPRRPRGLPAARHPPGRPGAGLADADPRRRPRLRRLAGGGALMDGERPLAIRAAEAAPRVKPSNYPEPFFSRMAKRVKHPLGDLFGLRNFGVNLTRLAPGGELALLHRHSRQDEFVYILEGRPTLVTDQGEARLEPGMCAGFPAGGLAHQLVNRTDLDVVYLEIGDRTPGDEGSYPADDLTASLGPDGWVFQRKDGTSY